MISVVIPTRDRPELLRRALDSALGQTHGDIEVIVVVDGQHPATEALLASIGDPRLRWTVNPESVGGSEARNIGVRAAAGEWVAFMDDDDEWLAAKLERQLAAAASHAGPVIVSCRIVTRTPRADYVGPDRPLRRGEHLSDFLFRPRRPFARGARMQTSALLVTRELALSVPWDPEVRRFQDFDWLLRANAAGAAVIVVPEVLSIWYYGERRPTIGASHSTDWRQALRWIDERRHLVSRRAYARWVLARTAAIGAAAPDGPSMRELLRLARRHGSPAPIDLLQFAYFAAAGWLARTRLSASADAEVDAS